MNEEDACDNARELHVQDSIGPVPISWIDTYRDALINVAPGWDEERDFAIKNGPFHPQVVANHLARTQALKDQEDRESNQLKRKKAFQNIKDSIVDYLSLICE